MANFSIKANLLKIKGAFVTNLKGKTATRRCLVIDIDESGMFLGEKGCYLNMAAIEMNETRYGDTHVVKVSLAKDVVEKMTEEERKAIPILGGMHPLQSQAQQIQGQLDGASVCENLDDLPF